MNPFEFVLLALIIIGVFGVARARMGQPRVRDRHGPRGLLADQGDPLETERLRDEMLRLKERVQVLERIATDKDDTLTRQIDSLRDR